MSYRYPYGNTEQMNLDWFLNQWEKFKADWAEAKAGIDGSLDAEIAKVEAAMSELYAARDAAAASATAARQSSLDAAAAQVAAGNSKTAAQAAETAARGSQTAAAQSAQEAQASAQGAENSALTASQAANTATQQAAGADAAKGAAEAAQQAAEAAQATAAQSAGQAGQAATAAGDHADDAADSATLAQQAAQAMSDSVAQITTNKNDISVLKESFTEEIGYFAKGTVSNGTRLFSTSDVSVGDTIYYQFTVISDKAGYIELFDANDTRIGYIGKGSSSGGALTYRGSFIVPQDFSYAVASTTGSYITFDYLSKYRPISVMSADYEDGTTRATNLLDYISFSSNRAIRASTGESESRPGSGLSVSSYISVTPGQELELDFTMLESGTWGHAFSALDFSVIYGVYSTSENKKLIVPENAAYFRVTIHTSERATAKIYASSPAIAELKSTVDANNPFNRKELKSRTTTINGFSHVGFPRLAYFNQQEYMIYRCGKKHLPPTETENWAVAQIDTIDPYGTNKHIKALSYSDFTACSGDARDFSIQASRDGEYLFVTGGFTHYTNSDVFYDCVIAVMDKTNTITDYKTFLESSIYFYGKVLMTPTNHIMFTAYNKSQAESYIYRSTAAFTGTVSDLTFEVVKTISVQGISESCIGYCNGKLVLLQRLENLNNAKMTVTENLEGTDGWSDLADLGLVIESPQVLPYYKGEYLPFAGSCKTGANNRYPVFGYIDMTNKVVKCSGNIDASLPTALNGYPDFVNVGGENYDVAYYNDNVSSPSTQTIGAMSAMYYKRINTREIVSGASYIV